MKHFCFSAFAFLLLIVYLQAADTPIVIELEGRTDHNHSAAFSPDGKKVAMVGARSGGESAILIWDVETGKELQRLIVHREAPDSFRVDDRFSSVAFSPDGKKIVTSGWDNFIRIWNADSGEELLHWKGYTGGGNQHVYFVAFSPDGKNIASQDNDTRIWDAESGREVQRFRGKANFPRRDRDSDFPNYAYRYGFFFAPDGKKFFVTTGANNTARIVDWTTEPEVGIRGLRGHTAGVGAMAFSRDGKKVVTGSRDTTVRIWDVATGNERQRLEGHTGDIHFVAFSPDGTKVVTISEDKTVRIWDLSAIPEHRPGEREPVRLANVTILFEGADVFQQEGIHEWAGKAARLAAEYYPKFDKLLEADGTPPQAITMIFQKRDGIARTTTSSSRSGGEPTIAISAEWIKQNPEDIGLVASALARIILGYYPRRTELDWKREGIADYIRYAHYEPEVPLPKIDPDTASYTDSSKTTAGFFIWIEKNYDKEFVKKLNVALRARTYSDVFFEDHTGKNLDDLWAEYGRTFR